jgi:hypothetical protein
MVHQRATRAVGLVINPVDRVFIPLGRETNTRHMGNAFTNSAAKVLKAVTPKVFNARMPYRGFQQYKHVSPAYFAAHMPTRGFQAKGFFADPEFLTLLQSEPVKVFGGAHEIRMSDNWVLKKVTAKGEFNEQQMATGSQRNAQHLIDWGFGDVVDPIPLNFKIPRPYFKQDGTIYAHPLHQQFKPHLKPGVYQLQKKAPGRGFMNNKPEFYAYQKDKRQLPYDQLRYEEAILAIERRIRAIPGARFGDHLLDCNGANVFVDKHGKITFVDLDPEAVEIPAKPKN